MQTVVMAWENIRPFKVLPKFLLSSASVAACMMAASALAQETRDQIVVTGEKREQGLQDAPVSITVLTGQALQNLGADTFSDYAVTVPSLSFVSLAPGDQRVNLRGVSDSLEGGSTQGTTGFYLDDMSFTGTLFVPDLKIFDIQQVEILKGPQGTLYGDASVGGLIRIVTNKADPSQFEGAAQFTVSSTEHGGENYEVNGMVNAPLVQDKLALRLVGYYRSNGGFIDNLTLGEKDVNDEETFGVRGSLRYTPTDRLTFTANALFQDTEFGDRSFEFEEQDGDLNKTTFNNESLMSDFSIYNLTIENDFDFAQLTSSSSYSIFDHTLDTDFTDLVQSIFGIPLSSIGNIDSHQETFSQEVRLASTPDDGFFDWLIGLYYFNLDTDETETDVTEGLTDLLGLAGTPFDVGTDVIFLGDFRNKQETFAAFGEASIHPTDKLTATFGARWFTNDLSSTEAGGGVVSESAPFVLTRSASEDDVVFKFRLAYEANDGILLYALASQGFRAGGINSLNPFAINDPDFPPSFESDSLWNYEFGWKTALFDNQVFVNGAVFYIDWDNVQIQQTLPGGFTIIGNGGAAHSVGVEGDVLIQPSEYFSLAFGGSYIDAQLDADALALGAMDGDRLPGVPKVKFFATPEVRFPIFENWDAFVRGNVSYTSDMVRGFGADASVIFGDYVLANVSAGVETDDGFSVTVFMENAGDERAALLKTVALRGTAFESTEISVPRPRTIGVTLRKDF